MKKLIIAAAVLASTAAVTLPTTADAFSVRVGPRGGVGIGLGGGYGYGYRGYGYRRPVFEGRSAYVRPGWRRGWNRY